MRAANCAEEPYGPPRQVVGVVGTGHVTGIEANWMKACDIRRTSWWFLLHLDSPLSSGCLSSTAV